MSAKLLSNLYMPLKAQVRHRLGLNIPRGVKLRKEHVPLQLHEDLPLIQQQIKETGGPTYEQLKHADYFNVHNLFTVTDLFDARVHYGHKEGTLDDRMRPYLYGSRLGHTIFDLDKTAVYLRKALNFAAHIAFRNGIILFLSRNPEFTYLVEQTAQECNEFAHTRAWQRGIFTNSEMIYGAVTRLPDLCIFLNTLNDVLEPHKGLSEAAQMLIPTIGICDSNCNPNLVSYPVPGNDDTFVTAQLYCRLFKEAVLRGKEKRKAMLAQIKERQAKQNEADVVKAESSESDAPAHSIV